MLSRLVISSGGWPHSGQATTYADAAGVKRNRQGGQQIWVIANRLSALLRETSPGKREEPGLTERGIERTIFRARDSELMYRAFAKLPTWRSTQLTTTPRGSRSGSYGRARWRSRASTSPTRREFAMRSDEVDRVRRLLCHEPRGHADMYGCFPVAPDDDGADLGVLFWHKDGYSTACGHGTIALGTWAVESGRVAAPDDGTDRRDDRRAVRAGGRRGPVRARRGARGGLPQRAGLRRGPRRCRRPAPRSTSPSAVRSTRSRRLASGGSG